MAETVELGANTTPKERKALENIVLELTISFPCKCYYCGYQVKKADDATLIRHPMGGWTVVHEECMADG